MGTSALLRLALASLGLVLLAPIVAAQPDAAGGDGGTPFEVPAAIRWVLSGPREAALTILAGAVVGAFLSALSFVGGEVPGTIGAVDLKLRRAVLEAERKHLHDILEEKGTDREALERLKDVRDREKELTKERRSQQAVASALYIVAAVVAAFLFAENMWAAIGVGLAGPAVLGTLVKSRASAELSALAARYMKDAQDLTPETLTDDPAGSEAEATQASAPSTPPVRGTKEKGSSSETKPAEGARQDRCCCGCCCCGPATLAAARGRNKIDSKKMRSAARQKLRIAEALCRK